jgi:hypothetical protein
MRDMLMDITIRQYTSIRVRVNCVCDVKSCGLGIGQLDAHGFLMVSDELIGSAMTWKKSKHTMMSFGLPGSCSVTVLNMSLNCRKEGINRRMYTHMTNTYSGRTYQGLPGFAKGKELSMPRFDLLDLCICTAGGRGGDGLELLCFPFPCSLFGGGGGGGHGLELLCYLVVLYMRAI